MCKQALSGASGGSASDGSSETTQAAKPTIILVASSPSASFSDNGSLQISACKLNGQYFPSMVKVCSNGD